MPAIIRQEDEKKKTFVEVNQTVRGFADLIQHAPRTVVKLSSLSCLKSILL